MPTVVVQFSALANHALYYMVVHQCMLLTLPEPMLIKIKKVSLFYFHRARLRPVTAVPTLAIKPVEGVGGCCPAVTGRCSGGAFSSASALRSRFVPCFPPTAPPAVTVASVPTLLHVVQRYGRDMVEINFLVFIIKVT